MPTFQIQSGGKTLEIQSQSELSDDDLKGILDDKSFWGEPEKLTAKEYTPEEAAALIYKGRDKGAPESVSTITGMTPSESASRAEAGGKAFEAAMHEPMISLPGIDESFGKSHPYVSGSYDALKSVVEGLSTPENIAIILGTAGVGLEAKAGSLIAKRALFGISGYFGAQMAQAAGEQAGAASVLLEDPNATTREKVAAVAAPVLSATASVISAFHAVNSIRPEITSRLKGLSGQEAADVLRKEADVATTGHEKVVFRDAADTLENAELDARGNAILDQLVAGDRIRQSPQGADLLRQQLSEQEKVGQVRAEDFTKARAEEAQQGIDAGRLANPEEIILGEDPLKNQRTFLDTKPGEAVRERARIEAGLQEQTPVVDEGEITAGLSPQAQRMYDEHGRIDPLVMAQLAGTSGGALYGFTQGKSPEEKIQKAFGYGTLGFLAGKFGPGFLSAASKVSVTSVRGRLDLIRRQMAGETAPRTSKASEASGNSLVAFASAPATAMLDAAYKAGQVLGEKSRDKDFNLKLGATLVEDRLRAIRQGFQELAANAKDPKTAIEFGDKANRVTSTIGMEGSPFKSESDFNSALSDPEIISAIERHRQIVQPLAQEMHAKTGGSMAQAGVNTDAYVNLKAILGEDGANEVIGGGSRQGDVTASMKRGSRFGKTAEGTAQKYELNYDEIAKRMVEGNYVESAKRNLYAQLEADGLGKELPVGEPPPDFNGQNAVKIPVESRARGQQAKNLWVRSDIAPEIHNVMNFRESLVGHGLAQLAKGINLVQLTGPTDAVFHTANIISSLSSAAGGKNILLEIARKTPGVNVATGLMRMQDSISRLVENSPEVQKRLVELSKAGALKPNMEGMMGTIDTAARLALDSVFDELVKSKTAVDSVKNRREFINQLGQYNPKLQGNVMRLTKELGLSPFVVAGTNFNKLAIRQIIGSPGFETTNSAATAKLYAQNIAGLVTGLVAIPAAANYLINGNVMGRDGTPFGAIDTGKDDSDGKHIIVDPQKWTNTRRGMRITGLNAIVDGIQKGKDADRIGGESIRDVLWGQAHPWVGPAPEAAYTAVTGESPSGFQIAKKLNARSVNPSLTQYIENAKAGVEGISPVYESILKGSGKGKGIGGPVKELISQLGGAVGVREVTDFPAERGRAESAVESSSREIQQQGKDAIEIYKGLEKMSPADRTKPLGDLQQKDPILFNKVLDEFSYQMKGLDPTTRAIARLPVEDGSRARFLQKELSMKKTKEEKVDFVKKLIESEVLTDDVAEQLGALLSLK
jgi:hypothetical protein